MYKLHLELKLGRDNDSMLNSFYIISLELNLSMKFLLPVALKYRLFQ